MKIIQGLNGENIDVVLPQLWGVETGSWDESMASSIPKIRNRLNLFPDGLWRFVTANKIFPFSSWLLKHPSSEKSNQVL